MLRAPEGKVPAPAPASRQIDRDKPIIPVTVGSPDKKRLLEALQWLETVSEKGTDR